MPNFGNGAYSSLNEADAFAGIVIQTFMLTRLDNLIYLEYFITGEYRIHRVLADSSGSPLHSNAQYCIGPVKQKNRCTVRVLPDLYGCVVLEALLSKHVSF